MSDAGAIVLCGGRSSRMGRAKAWLPWRGVAMVVHVVEVLRAVVDEVVVVTSDALDLPPLRARVVRDEQPGLGPLAGLAAGLASADSSLCFATSTDAPFLTPDFVRAVLAPGVAAAPVADGFVQTLSAAYPAREGAREGRALLAAERRRPLELLEALGYQALDANALPGARALRGFNTPEEYLAAVADDARESGGTATASLEFVGHARSCFGHAALVVPVGSLETVLSHASGEMALCEDGRVAPPFLVSLGGRDFVRDLAIPVGPGERVIVLDRAAGG